MKNDIKPILQVNNISAFYERNKNNPFWQGSSIEFYKQNKKYLTLQDINIDFYEKSFYTILGSNGSGKSTLLNILCGINNPSLTLLSGEVTLNQKNISKIDKKEIAKEIAFLAQSEKYAWNHLVKDVVLMGRYPHSKGFFGYTKEDQEEAEKAMEECGILELQDRHIFELSGGEYQLVLLARSLCQNAKILVLDEPFTHLDISNQQNLLVLLKRLVEEKNLCVIITLHDLNQTAIFSDNVIILKNGKIFAQGDVKTIFTKRILDEAFDCVFFVLEHPTLGYPQVFPG